MSACFSRALQQLGSHSAAPPLPAGAHLCSGPHRMLMLPPSPASLTPAGHARVYVAFDVIYRYLRHLGYDVRGAGRGDVEG